MEKVRPWCGQPSNRGRLKNRTELTSNSRSSSSLKSFLLPFPSSLPKLSPSHCKFAVVLSDASALLNVSVGLHTTSVTLKVLIK